jgi:hypothetical protein
VKKTQGSMSFKEGQVVRSIFVKSEFNAHDAIWFGIGAFEALTLGPEENIRFE